MSDVSELVERCREPLSMSKFLRKDDLLARANEDRALAADALETLAGEVAELREAVELPRLALINQRNAARARELDAESRLAKLAVEVKDLEIELECVKKQREDYFSEYKGKLIECIEMKIALAKLAPVVDAARQVLAHSSGFEGDLAFCKKMSALESSIAALGGRP